MVILKKVKKKLTDYNPFNGRNFSWPYVLANTSSNSEPGAGADPCSYNLEI